MVEHQQTAVVGLVRHKNRDHSQRRPLPGSLPDENHGGRVILFRGGADKLDQHGGALEVGQAARAVGDLGGVLLR
jgi:hypothetical protein